MKAPPYKAALGRPSDSTWMGDKTLNGGDWGSARAARHEGRKFAGLDHASRVETERRREEPEALNGAGGAYCTRQMAEGVPSLAPRETGDAFGESEWVPRAADDGYGQTSSPTPGLRLTSAEAGRPRGVTSHGHSWQPNPNQAGATEARPAFSHGPDFEREGHSAIDARDRYAYGDPSYHVDRAGDRIIGKARESGQAQNESGENIGGGLKRRRDDVASDAEPRAKRGGDSSVRVKGRLRSRILSASTSPLANIRMQHSS